MTPRRFGKSTAVACFVAALLLERPGIRIAVFSPGSRASSGLMEIILSMLEFAGVLGRILKHNDEKLYLAANDFADGITRGSTAAKKLHSHPSTSKLLSFPSGVNSTYWNT
jgi:tRNA(Met) C34 N-acetyltransferase TmcA